MPLRQVSLSRYPRSHAPRGNALADALRRVRRRIRRLVYLDAFVPVDGESLISIVGKRADWLKSMTKGDYIVPMWVKPDQKPPKDVPQPLKTFTEALALKNEAARKIPATYVLTVEKSKTANDDDFFAQSERAKERGWPVLQLTADHNPQWSAPNALANTLSGIR